MVLPSPHTTRACTQMFTFLQARLKSAPLIYLKSYIHLYIVLHDQDTMVCTSQPETIYELSFVHRACHSIWSCTFNILITAVDVVFVSYITLILPVYCKHDLNIIPGKEYVRCACYQTYLMLLILE